MLMSNPPFGTNTVPPKKTGAETEPCIDPGRSLSELFETPLYEEFWLQEISRVDL